LSGCFLKEPPERLAPRPNQALVKQLPETRVLLGIRHQTANRITGFLERAK
jgi:hypothetical protein